MCLLIGYMLCGDISGAGLCVASEEEVKKQRVCLPLLLLFLSSQQQDEQRGRDRVAAYWEAYVLLSALPGNLEKLVGISVHTELQLTGKPWGWHTVTLPSVHGGVQWSRLVR